MAEIKLTEAQERALLMAALRNTICHSYNGAAAVTLNSLARKGLLGRLMNTRPARFYITDAGRAWLAKQEEESDDPND